MHPIFEQLKNQLIVSCQAEEGSPFNNPQGVNAFAECAIQGGAAGIRSCGIEKIDYIIKNTHLPVIGLTKAQFPDGTVCITGSFEDVDKLVALNTPIIAVDGTHRKREQHLSGSEFIAQIKQKYPSTLIMADVSTLSEAQACFHAGADCISTTLCGYTPDTLHEAKQGPSIDFLKACVKEFPNYPIFAEGRYNTPNEAAAAINNGAWAVVVGSAITRPHLITQWFVEAINNI